MRLFLLFVFLFCTSLVRGAVVQNQFVTNTPTIIVSPGVVGPIGINGNQTNKGNIQATNVIASGAGAGHVIVSETNSLGFADFFNTGSNLTARVAATNTSGTLHTNSYTFDGFGNVTNINNLQTLGNVDISGNVSAPNANFGSTISALLGAVNLNGGTINNGDAKFTTANATTVVASNSLVVVSNTYPITAWNKFGNSWTAFWQSNDTVYALSTNSLAGTATTNKIVPPTAGGGSTAVWQDSMNVLLLSGANTSRYLPIRPDNATGASDTSGFAPNAHYYQHGGIISNIVYGFEGSTYTAGQDEYLVAATNGGSTFPASFVDSALWVYLPGTQAQVTNSGTRTLVVPDSTWVLLRHTNIAVSPGAKYFVVNSQWLPN